MSGEKGVWEGVGVGVSCEGSLCLGVFHLVGLFQFAVVMTH